MGITIVQLEEMRMHLAGVFQFYNRLSNLIKI